MISGTDLYHVITAMVPLYVAMFLAYASRKWWKIFTPEQCSGINRFVALFSVPLLSFDFISSNNPYAMNLRFILADTLQKIISLIALFIWANFIPGGSLDWSITLFSLSTLPNTLVMGIPLLKSMYGDFSAALMAQVVALQALVWTTVLLILFECRAAKILINEQFHGIGGSIGSIKVGSDVHSLDGREPLEAETELGEDGKVHMKLRKSSSCSSASLSRFSHMSNVEIYSLLSIRNPGSKGSSFDNIELSSSVNEKGLHDDDDTGKDPQFVVRSLSTSCLPVFRVGGPNKAAIADCGHYFEGLSQHTDVDYQDSRKNELGSGHRLCVNKAYGQGPTTPSLGSSSILSKACSQWESTSRPNTNGAQDGPPLSKLGSRSMRSQPTPVAEGEPRPTSKPPARVMTELILVMVWRKLVRNPNTYSVFNIDAFFHFYCRFHIKLPKIVADSIQILSKTGLGMAMFGLGKYILHCENWTCLFMALQPKIIACGKTVAASTMAVRFFVGPALMAATSAAVGIRGALLHLAIVQATLPQAVLSFVFAREYNLHAEIMSTGVIFGMLISLPFTLVYFIVLGLIK
ncbi:hypothetical protein Cgig2_001424 [Carnegiea gigantea]|uniref:Auxin efflux carrier component n=1 Tax=Carnegiea gigantea TaxID=171969 RepID=A0A9Q1KUG5_9CARY|nr:hypothetical protein Cgig2_001424 [Carnegiea gigantea]